MDDLLQEFLLETSENLALLDAELIKLEQQPDDGEALGSIFRLMHTIKGTCGFLDLPRLASVAHAGEDVLGRFREGSLPITPDAVTLVLKCIDRIRELLAALEARGAEPDDSDDDLVGQLREFVAAGAAASETAPRGTDSTSTEPSPAPVMSPEGFPVAAELLEEFAAAVSGGDAGTTTKGEAAETLNSTAESQFAPTSHHAGSAGRSTPGNRAASAPSVRVSVDVLESLMTLVSELVLTRNQLAQRFRGRDDIDIAEPFQRLSLITTDLQAGVMKTRMQPIGNAWAKLPRLVRDLSIETNKKIELRMHGESTELDRQVLEVVKDPLTHMVRNSADHGLEAPAERLAAGKPETGVIDLNAFHESGHIIVQVSDDGRGLDCQRIAEKAVEKGLTTRAELERLSEQQVQQFIFSPGFSTSEAVTSVSGRGVGMDVVRTNIERIGGTVELKSVPAQGTILTVKIPLTLGIVSALIIGCKGERYAIPQISVRELVRVAATDLKSIESVHDAPVFRLRNRLLPLVRLRDILELDESDESNGSFFIVVTKVGGLEFGIVVDEVFDTEEIVIKPVTRILRHIPFYSGNTILGDGSVVMIIDPNGVAGALGQNTVSAVADRAEATDQQSQQRTSMLVFRSGSPTPKAVPMALVSRLEEISGRAVEYADGRPVLQYRDELMPLVSLNGDPKFDNDAKQPVLVFAERGRMVGLVVDEIVDIVEAIVRVGLVAHTPGVIGTTVFNGIATDVMDIGHHLAAADVDWFGADNPAAKGYESTVQRRVLVVDDSPFFLKLMVPLLQTRGYEVVAAPDAEQALKLMENAPLFDAIITDIEMPNMNGFEFMEAIRAVGAWSDIPVIALSSNLSPANMRRGRSLDFVDLIPKAQRNTVLEVIDQVMGRLGEAA